jgi:glycosyltransferase involved in cell wall biosynthesis
MQTELITPLIITFNEEANIARVLDGLHWAKAIVVIDSGSTDATLSICARYPQVRVVHRAFDSFAEQCNAGLKEISTPWVLSMDADYVADQAFFQALQQVDGQADGYRIAFRYCIGGKPIRCGFYAARVSLYQVAGAEYHNDGHAHRIQRPGRIDQFPSKLDHDDRKPLARWLQSQSRYLPQEADKLLALSNDQLSLPDRIRKTAVLGPIAMFFYVLFVRLGILDGWAGWRYACERVYAELLLSLHLLERRKSR